VRKSIEELSPVILWTNVRLALENMANDDFKLIGQLLEEFGSDLVGICYDCGHGNIRKGEGLDHLERFKDRLIAVHIHDNDGTADHHWVPFTGTVDFPRLARIIAASSYTGCISLESNINSLPEVKKATFVKDAFEAATRLAQMVEDEKESLSKQEA